MRLDVLDIKRFMIWSEAVERIQRLVFLILLRSVLSQPVVSLF